MARVDLKAALIALQGTDGFRQYVSILESEYADVMSKILVMDNAEYRTELCAEARVYRDILQGITSNLRK